MSNPVSTNTGQNPSQLSEKRATSTGSGRAFIIHDQGACYYLTMQVVHWVDIFTRKNYRDMIVSSLNHCIHVKGLEIFAYVIMSNHIHILCRSKNENLSSILRDFKRYTSREILKLIQEEPESRREWILKLFSDSTKVQNRIQNFQVWTHENYCVEIFSPRFTVQKINYIHENPVRAGIVESPEHYMYSSAYNYFHGDGLVNVEELSLRALQAYVS